MPLASATQHCCLAANISQANKSKCGTIVVPIPPRHSLLPILFCLLVGRNKQGFSPLIWFGLNIQLHAGRSKRRAAQRFILSAATKNQKLYRLKEEPTKVSTKAGYAVTFARSQPIAPTEALVSP